MRGYDQAEGPAGGGGACSRQTARLKQSVVLRLTVGVAFAGGLAQAFEVGDSICPGYTG